MLYPLHRHIPHQQSAAFARLTWLLSVALLTTLAACGGGQDFAAPTARNTADTAQSPRATAAAVLNPACTAGSTLNIVAHQDDDLLFLNPDIAKDIAAGRCVRTVFLTAGDNNLGASYWQGREAGIQAAYGVMAGVANNWTSTDAGIPGKPAVLRTLSGTQVSVVYLRLPDGQGSGGGSSNNAFESLQKLYQGGIFSIRTVDGSTSYTKVSLTTAIASLINNFMPNTVRTQNFNGAFGDGDHSDHIAASFLVREASAQSGVPHTLVAYADYVISTYPSNVAGDDLRLKQSAWNAYVAFDREPCGSPPACNGNLYDQWLTRQYTTGSLIVGTATGANLALGRPATASSVETAGFEPGRAVDGVGTTRWSSAYSDNQWLQVDLGTTTTVDTVEVSWEVAYASRYQVLTSTDGVTWTSVAVATPTSAGTQRLSFAATAARYVRIAGQTRATGFGYSIYELRVFGGGSTPPPPPPPANQAPTVALTALAGGTSVASGTAVTLSATAADADGSVARVEFYAGGTLLGTDTTAPYALSWTPTAGTYTLTARAFDNTGAATTSAALGLTVTAAPAPAPGPVISPSFGSSTAGTAFTDPVAVGQVLTGVTVRAGWWIDGIQGLATPANLPARGGTGGGVSTVTWLAGEYLVRIYGSVGSNGLLGQIAFVTQTGRVLGPYGTAQGIGALTPFDYTVPAGNRVLGFTGRSGTSINAIGVIYGPVTSQPPIVTNQPPTVALTAPTNNASILQGTAISVAATAADADGSVARVEFYAGGTLLGTDTTAPYALSWTPTAGAYTLTARAFDNTGAATTSAALGLTVTATPAPTPGPGASPLFGSSTAGTAFTDPVASGQVLTGVTVRAGWWIDGIQGLATPANLPARGGTGGGVYTVTWPAGEYLVRIYGSQGSDGLVGQIAFVTQTGRVLGPYGTAQGIGALTPFDYTVPAGNRVLGFTGRSGTSINAIGVIYGP